MITIDQNRAISKRWFKGRGNSPQEPVEETLIYGLAGTNGILSNDPRLRSIGETVNGLDSWLLLAVTNPAYTPPVLPFTKKVIKRLNPNTLNPETIQVIDKPILNNAYFESDHWYPLDLPIRGNLEEITEDEYLQLISVEAKKARDNRVIP